MGDRKWLALVTGRGTTFDKRDLVGEARRAAAVFERQDVETRTVRVWGATDDEKAAGGR